MIKIFCDNCDEEVPMYKNIEIGVESREIDREPALCRWKNYHFMLCEKCYSKLIKPFNDISKKEKTR